MSNRALHSKRITPKYFCCTACCWLWSTKNKVLIVDAYVHSGNALKPPLFWNLPLEKWEITLLMKILHTGATLWYRQECYSWGSSRTSGFQSFPCFILKKTESLHFKACKHVPYSHYYYYYYCCCCCCCKWWAVSRCWGIVGIRQLLSSRVWISNPNPDFQVIFQLPWAPVSLETVFPSLHNTNILPLFCCCGPLDCH